MKGMLRLPGWWAPPLMSTLLIMATLTWTVTTGRATATPAPLLLLWLAHPIFLLAAWSAWGARDGVTRTRHAGLWGVSAVLAAWCAVLLAWPSADTRLAISLHPLIALIIGIPTYLIAWGITECLTPRR